MKDALRCQVPAYMVFQHPYCSPERRLRPSKSTFHELQQDPMKRRKTYEEVCVQSLPTARESRLGTGTRLIPDAAT